MTWTFLIIMCVLLFHFLLYFVAIEILPMFLSHYSADCFMLYALNALTDISLCFQWVLSGNNQYWTCLGMRWHVHCRGEWGCLLFSRSSLNIQTITDHWTMCFLLMTLVVQKLCVNIYVYMYYIPYTSSVIGRIYAIGVSFSIGEAATRQVLWDYFWGVCGSFAECHFLFSLVYEFCLALW